jgi:DedD protein
VSEDVPSRDRRARRRGPGLASALLGGALLIAVGFGLGVLAGLLLEEPDLVLDYAAGRTQDVTLEPIAGTGTGAPVTADVAARPPQGSEAPRPADLPEVLAQTPPAEREPPHPPGTTLPRTEVARATPRPTQPPPTPSGRFAIQVGAFSEATAAEQLARRLRDAGLPVYVAPSVGVDAERWRVRVGPMASREEAEEMARRLERDEQLSTWVLAESPL